MNTTILLLILMLNGFECLSYEDDVDFGYFEGKLFLFLKNDGSRNPQNVRENLKKLRKISDDKHIFSRVGRSPHFNFVSKKPRTSKCHIGSIWTSINKRTVEWLFGTHPKFR